MTLHVAKDGQGIWLALLMLDSFTARLLSEGSRSYGAASHPADAGKVLQRDEVLAVLAVLAALTAL